MQTQGMSETNAWIVKSVFQATDFIGAYGVSHPGFIEMDKQQHDNDSAVSIVWCATP